MTDKIQTIKDEIFRLKHNTPNAYDLSRFMLLEEIESFINSLPEEPASEDLEEAMELSVNEEPLLEFFATGQPTICAYGKDSLRNQFEAGAEWQKQKDYKTYAHVPLKDIHDAWYELKNNKPDIENSPAICFCRGANWRENQMKESLQTEYEKGLFDMQQEMMKGAVEGEYWIGEIHLDTPIIQGYNDGDRIKFVPIKDKQQ